MKIKIYSNTLRCLVVFCMYVLSSCSPENKLPTIEEGYSTYVVDLYGSDKWVNRGYPETYAIFTGKDLNDIQSVVFDGKVSAVFNPSLNSSNAIKFVIPFDEKLGSRFGVQTVTFTNKRGQSFSTQFEILQPQPKILSFNVKDSEKTVADPGDVVEINGKWFYDIKQLIVDGNVITNYTVVSPEKITFSLPNPLPNLNDSQEVKVINDIKPLNPALDPSNVSYLDVFTGFDKVLLCDFGNKPLSNQGSDLLDEKGYPVYDAKGYVPSLAAIKQQTGFSDDLITKSNFATTPWVMRTIGAVKDNSPGNRSWEVESDENKRRGKFISFQWDDTKTQSFVGLDMYNPEKPYLFNPDPAKIQTDPTKVIFSIDIKGTAETLGTTGFIYLTDERSLYSCLFTVNKIGWYTFEIKLSDFGFGFNPADVRPTRKLRPASVKELRICLNNNPGTNPTPEILAAVAKPNTKYYFDNIYLKYVRP